ncbi:hypothetical protein ACFPYI_03820 [Halomarina salina]|uniref:Cox cluster protein n=1 Tax=Halomarina salina TaxID=1872699 RepID=A0ABD5RIT1_9EURY|nr:hypothetical protein [Halomarina salina]
MASDYGRRNRSTPLGIYLVGGLAILGGVEGILGGLGQIGSIVGIPFGVVSIVLGVAGVLVGLGLLTRSRTAYTVALLVFGLRALAALVTFDVVGLLIAVVVVGYLLSKSAYFH